MADLQDFLAASPAKVSSGSTLNNSRKSALFLLVATAQISHFGNQIGVVAVPWYIIAETGDPTLTAVTGFAVLAPVFLHRAGDADRFGVLALCVGCDLVAAVGTCLVPLFDPEASGSMGWLLVMLFLASFAGLTSAYSCRLLIASSATRVGVRPETANSTYFTTQRVALVFRPEVVTRRRHPSPGHRAQRSARGRRLRPVLRRRSSSRSRTPPAPARRSPGTRR